MQAILKRFTLQTHHRWFTVLLTVITSGAVPCYAISFNLSLYLRSDRDTQPPAGAPGLHSPATPGLYFSSVSVVSDAAQSAVPLAI